MGGFSCQGARRYASLGLSLCGVAMLAGCFYSQRIDLADNPYIYQSTNYHAPRSTESPVYITRLQYKEQEPDFSDRDSVKTLESDRIWERRLPVMVEEILLDEVDDSGIYRGISSGSNGVPRSKDYVIEPTLLALQRYREVITNGPKIGKRRNAAYAAMRVKVLSPMDASGKREVLLDKVYQDLVMSKLGLMRPDKGIVYAGQALRNVMGELMLDLYQSNVRAIPGAPKK